ncbi:MAG TPA: hypothetical protein VK619_04980 [Pyrinomonadaceae bacterium]|nr:hypothetical protein [Pyrinomonadaceae bacterium]
MILCTRAPKAVKPRLEYSRLLTILLKSVPAIASSLHTHNRLPAAEALAAGTKFAMT